MQRYIAGSIKIAVLYQENESTYIVCLLVDTEQVLYPGESLPPCRGLWAHFTQGTILIVILVSSGSAKSRTHQFAVGGFLVTRRGWPGRLRACRIWRFINSV